MKKQTAVEWLIQSINERIDLRTLKYWNEINEFVEQAKAMEKEQIVDAVNEGIKQGYRDYIDTEWGRDNDYNPEQYYNETYS